MSILIKGMEMPKSGVYEISVDNTNGQDKTGMTVYKRKDNGFIHVFGTYELVPVPPHGRLIDADALLKTNNPVGKAMVFGGQYVYTENEIQVAPTIIEAEVDDG